MMSRWRPASPRVATGRRRWTRSRGREAEVLVVGSSRLGPVARVFLGSNATKIIRSSPVPVLVIPSSADVHLDNAAAAGRAGVE